MMANLKTETRLNVGHQDCTDGRAAGYNRDDSASMFLSSSFGFWVLGTNALCIIYDVIII